MCKTPLRPQFMRARVSPASHRGLRSWLLQKTPPQKARKSSPITAKASQWKSGSRTREPRRGPESQAAATRVAANNGMHPRTPRAPPQRLYLWRLLSEVQQMPLMGGELAKIVPLARPARRARLAIVDPFLRPLVHDRLIAGGRKAKAARTAVMPKRVVLANTLVRETRSWKPNHA